MVITIGIFVCIYFTIAFVWAIMCYNSLPTTSLTYTNKIWNVKVTLEKVINMLGWIEFYTNYTPLTISYNS